MHNNLIKKVEALLECIQLSKHCWKTDELKIEADELISKGNGVIEYIVEQVEYPNFTNFEKEANIFLNKVL